MKRIAYTPGEPSGIGIDLAILNTLSVQRSGLYQFVAIADPDVILCRARQLHSTIKLIEVNPDDTACSLQTGELGIIPVKTAKPVTTGKLDPDNAEYVLKTLDHAIAGCQQQHFHAMVTGPVQKSVINDAGINFSGHTEYLAEKTDTKQVVMLLATEGLRVALATTHIPLRDVASHINKPLLYRTLRILDHDLRNKFGIKEPHILVCGLNPHAGENGHLGHEDMDIIEPVLKKLKQEGVNCTGPLPADTLFTLKHLQHADAVMAMYHDQGLPVLKYKGFGAAANITLGLPIIRTSVDHGTALDLAGTGNINTGSLFTAIDYALRMQTGECS
jgi:4-hydroxythreonine-4-phosphate dehydrogenase